jgi:hypothetical protein
MKEQGPDDARSLPSARQYTTTALPPTIARLLAFVAILLGGLCGGLIGWSVTDLQCGGETISGRPTAATAEPAAATAAPASNDDGCASWSAGGALIGAVTGAGGVGIVSVLVLRAMAEWRRTVEVDELPRRAPAPPPA